MSVIGNHLLNASAVVQRENSTGDHGRWATSPTTIATIRCRKPFASSGRDTVMAERIEANVTHVTYVKPDQDIQVSDLIVTGGNTYEVKYVMPPSESHHLKVLLEIRQHGSQAN